MLDWQTPSRLPARNKPTLEISKLGTELADEPQITELGCQVDIEFPKLTLAKGGARDAWNGPAHSSWLHA